MKPVRLTLSGFLSYREEVTLDFTTFDLACISGENGAGKSSLLDAITWVLFGEARKRDDSIINLHPSITAAQVTLDFIYEENTYRVQRTSPRGKSTLLEFHIQVPGGGWKPLTERSIRGTQDRIVETLRLDYATFVNASFFLQGNADQFTQQRPGDRKEILGKILGLEIWETYREQAAQKRKAVENELLQLDGQLKEINNELAEEETRRNRLAELESRLALLSGQRSAQEKTLENIQKLTAALNEQKRWVDNLQRQADTVRQRLEQDRARLEGRTAERQEYQQAVEHQEEIHARYQQLQLVRAALAELDQTAERHRDTEKKRQEPLLAIQAERSRLESERGYLAAQQQAIEKALAERPALEEKLLQAKAGQEAAEAQAALRTEMESQVQTLRSRQVELNSENNRLRTEMKDLKERMVKLEETEGAVCPLCGQPLSPADRERLIQELNAQGTAKKGVYVENQMAGEAVTQEIAGMQTELNRMGNVQAVVIQHVRQVEQAARQVEVLLEQEAEWQSTGRPRLAEVETKLAEETYAQEARAALKAVDDELVRTGYHPSEHEARRSEEQELRPVEESLRTLEKAAAALGPLNREIQELESQVSEQQTHLAELESEHTQTAASLAETQAGLPDLYEAEQAVLSIKGQENRLRMDLGAAQSNVAVLAVQKTRQSKLAIEREVLGGRISKYKQLERAFGKDGVPALLIEQALPQIETKANEILDRLSNGSMSIHFETQRDYKDKKRADKKETLDILISDSAGLRDYEMYSGGEAFRVNFSIRLALSEVLAQRAGARLQTLVIDEGFGSQDAIGRQRLVEAINMVRENFETILVITHIDELKDAFPTRIEVEKTASGSSLRVI